MIIESINTKKVTTKFGPKDAYSVKADGEWYSYGFKKPAFAIGDNVEFQFTENTYGKNVDMATVRVISKAAVAPASAPTADAPAAPARSYGPPAKVFPIPPLHGDRAIVRQNSLTNAVNMLREDKEFNELGETDRAELVIKIARMFEAYSCGDLDVERAKELAE